MHKGRGSDLMRGNTIPTCYNCTELCSRTETEDSINGYGLGTGVTRAQIIADAISEVREAPMEAEQLEFGGLESLVKYTF